MNLHNLLVYGTLFTVLFYFIARIRWQAASLLLSIWSGAGIWLSLSDKGSELTSFIGLSLGMNAVNRPFLTAGFFVILMISLFGTASLSRRKNKPVFLLLMWLISLSIGWVFSAGDLLTLFIFWETMTWAAFFIISMGEKRGIKAGRVFFFMSMISAYAMLAAIFILYRASGSLALGRIADGFSVLSPAGRTWVWALFVLAGLIKAGIFPLHVWVRRAYADAPVLFGTMLSGILSKFGFYILTLFVFWVPVRVFGSAVPGGLALLSRILAYIGGLSIMAGTVAAIVQKDARRLIAFSSISHGGYIVLALAYGTSMSVAGGLAHIWVHVLTALGMFLSIAAVMYRTGTSDMDEMGGLIKRMPLTFTVYLVAIISVAGIPPLAGFVSKWMIYQALISNGSYFLAFAAFFGSIGSFMYVFRPLATIFLGQLPNKYKDVKEVPFIMQLPMVVVTLLTIILGVLPFYLVRMFADVQVSAGMEPVVYTLSKLFSPLTTLDMMLVFLVFGGGFVFALIFYLLFDRPVRVAQHEQYTAGEIAPEIIDTPEIYHFTKGYYRPFSRIFMRWPSVEKWYEDAASGAEKIFSTLHDSFYRAGLGGMVWFAFLMLTLYLAIRWF